MLRFISAVGAFAILLSSCASPAAETSASLDHDFSLRIGQTGTVTGEPLRIRFGGIMGDSRCPTGAQCVWQGEVTARVEISYRQTAYEKVLTQPGLTSTAATAGFNEYDIEFNVLPYPEVGKQIPQGDYILRLKVHRK